MVRWVVWRTLRRPAHTSMKSPSSVALPALALFTWAGGLAACSAPSSPHEGARVSVGLHQGQTPEKTALLLQRVLPATDTAGTSGPPNLTAP